MSVSVGVGRRGLPTIAVLSFAVSWCEPTYLPGIAVSFLPASSL